MSDQFLGQANMKLLAISLSLVMTSLVACGNGSTTTAPAQKSAQHRVEDPGRGVLTREEVAAVLGKPVTSVEGTGRNLTYKTDVIQLETAIEVEEKDDLDEALQAMQGARTATGLLGGKPEAIAGLGDEAFFGAMSFLYIRKGNAVITITPPNLQQVAGVEAYEKVRDAKFGSDEQRAAMASLTQVEKTDPLATAGMKGGDAMQGAMATINAVSAKQGTDYETRTRAMAVALATRLLQKL
jgi:hypothetical protein